jgi:hypothetical protein
MKKTLISITMLTAFLFFGCGTVNDESSFLKKYSLKTVQTDAKTAKLIISSLANTTDGYIMTGSISVDQQNTDNRGEDGLLLKTDSNGNIEKALYIMYYDENIARTYPVNENFYDIAKSTNNKYLAITQISPTGVYTEATTFLTLFDDNLNIITAGTYNTSIGGLYIRHVKPLNDGTFLLIGDAEAAYDQYGNIVTLGAVVKMDIYGNVLWAKSYTTTEYYENYGYGSTTGDDWHYNDAAVTDDAIYISGYSINSFAQSSILLIKLDLNGNLIWAKEYNRKDDENYYPATGYDIVSVDNYLYLPFKDNDNTYTINNYGMLKIDYNGNVVDNKIYYNDNYMDEFALDSDSHGDIYIGYGPDFIKTDKNLLPIKSYTVYGGIKNGMRVDKNDNPLFFSFNQSGSLAQYAESYVTKFVDDKSCNDTYSHCDDITLSTTSDTFYVKSYDNSQVKFINLSISKNLNYQGGTIDNIQVTDLCSEE